MLLNGFAFVLSVVEVAVLVALFIGYAALAVGARERWYVQPPPQKRPLNYDHRESGDDNAHPWDDPDDFRVPPPRGINALEVEVLGARTLARLGPRHDPRHCYRIGPQLLTQEEVVEYLKRRQQGGPPLKAVTVVLYDDSPAENTPKVADLKDEVGALAPGGGRRLPVTILRRAGNAPR
jgi:hypothetical protein